MRALFTGDKTTLAVVVSVMMKNIFCSWHSARGWHLGEDLIASLFKLVVKVLIEPESSSRRNNKAKWDGFYRCAFPLFVLRKPS